MKKIVGLLAVVLIVIAAGAFWFQSKINETIASKISELNNNGFVVKHEQSTNYIKTSAKGEVEVNFPDKVVSYILADMKNLELKIRFAKKLLSKKVNKNIVAESLELTIEEIDYYVYSIQNNKINDEVYNSSIRTMESEYKKIKENKKHAPKQPYTPYMR